MPGEHFQEVKHEYQETEESQELRRRADALLAEIRSLEGEAYGDSEARRQAVEALAEQIRQGKEGGS